MTKRKIEKAANDKPPSASATTTPTKSDRMILIRRPRPGSVVILAPAGTPVSVSGTEEYKKIVLLEIPSE